jgi:hypothetical protein
MRNGSGLREDKVLLFRRSQTHAQGMPDTRGPVNGGDVGHVGVSASIEVGRGMRKAKTAASKLFGG